MRERKAIDYTEREETDLEEKKTAGPHDSSKEESVPAIDDEKPVEITCPVCWNSLVAEEVVVLALGCGHLVCEVCGEGVVLGGRGCPVCRNKNSVMDSRRIYL